MIHKKKLLQSDIRYACGDTFYERGRNYFNKDFVLSLEIEQDNPLSVVLFSSVKGSYEGSYDQNIAITWRPDYTSTSINGTCSCPVIFNCKHVVAACLAYQAREINSTGHSQSGCLEWLDSFDTTPTIKNKNREFIVYVLKPSDDDTLLKLDLVITKEKVAGGLTKGRPTSINSLRYTYLYENYVQETDREIGKYLSILDKSNKNQPLITGDTGFLLLKKLLRTGRLFWEDHHSISLTFSEKRHFQLAWKQRDNGDYKLETLIEPAAQLIATEPPCFLDASQGTIGLLNDQQFSNEQLSKVIKAPLVSAELAEEFSQRLLIEHPELPLPGPKAIQISEMKDYRPVPAIRLFGKQTGQFYIHFIGAGFQYGDYFISPVDQQDFSYIKSDQGLIRLKRDLTTEKQALDRLAEYGFELLQNHQTEEIIYYSPADKSIMDSAERWRIFIHQNLPQLEQEGWDITIDDSFLLDFRQAGQWTADISETDNNWFDLHFNVDVDGESLPLLPLIMPALEDYELDDIPEMLTIPVESHTYITVKGSVIKPFLDILYELFNTAALNENGTLTLSRFDAASLADVEIQNDGIFSMRGGEAIRELGQKLKDFTGIQQVALPTGFKAELRSYQQHGLNWLQFLREFNFSGILADDMGLGKTVQTLAHLLVEKETGRMDSPCMIIAPTSLISNWYREADRFAPDLRVLKLQGPDRGRDFDKINQYDLILTTYPLLFRDEKVLLDPEYHYLVLDEAQMIKNPRSKAARIVRQIKTRHRLCLTGTPMENHLGELWAQFDFLLPGFLGDIRFFKQKYRTPIEIHGDMQQRSRLSRRIAPFMLRRTKQEVETELPPKTEIIRSVPLYNKQAALYENIRITMEKKVRDTIADKGLSRSHITILDALLKLRQTCCDPRILSLKQAQKIKESAKLDLLMELVPELLEEGRRILIFSQFTRMITLIENELDTRNIAYSKLTGQTRKRDEAIQLFKSGDVDVFLISLKAGGLGLNLTEADTVIIYDPWWNPAAESQAADRAYRIGQDKPVFIYKLFTENTVEEKILAMQEKKRALAEGIYTEGNKGESFNLSQEDLTGLFAPLD